MSSTVRNFAAKWSGLGLFLLCVFIPPHVQGETRPCISHNDCASDAGETCLKNVCRGANNHDVFRLFTIAVSPFYDLTPDERGAHLAAGAEEILEGLLGSTVFFETLPKAAVPPTSMLEGWMGSTILFQSWSQKGAYGLVKGTIRETTTGELALTLRLYLVETGEQVHALNFSALVTPRTLRSELIRWADRVVGEFSGRPGILGTRIAYARQSKRGAPKEIYVTGLDGFEERPVTQNGSLNLLPSWGPKGIHVAYTSYQDNNPDLFIGDKKLSGFESLNMGAEWSPDGEEVALSLSKDGNNEIYVLDGETGAIKRRITNHPGIDSSPSWSSDGSRLVFVSDRTGSPQLYSTDSNGNDLIHLKTGMSYCTSPDWSPVGSMIAFNAMGANGSFNIFLYDMDTGRTKQLTHGNGSNEDPSWSPDARYMVFSSTRGTTRATRMKQLYVMSANGGKATRITRRNALYSTPAWSPW